jgi:hypothetical protein
VRPQPVSSDIPDGVLWAMDILPTGELVTTLKFSRHQFDAATIAGLATDFCQLLEAAVGDPDAPLTPRRPVRSKG